MNATKLRTNLYAVLDEVLETGKPVEIVRKGRRLRIVPDQPVRKTDNLVPHPGTFDDPEAIVHPDWTGLWDPDHARYSSIRTSRSGCTPINAWFPTGFCR